MKYRENKFDVFGVEGVCGYLQNVYEIHAWMDE